MSQPADCPFIFPIEADFLFSDTARANTRVVSLLRTASCEVHKVIPTLTKFDQSRDISLKSVNFTQWCLTLIAVLGVFIDVAAGFYLW